jgi:hypothetical protein
LVLAETNSVTVQCPQCQSEIVPANGADLAAPLDFPWNELEAGGEQGASPVDDETLEPGAQLDDDDSLWQLPDNSNVGADPRKEAAILQLQAANAQVARGRSLNRESGRASTSTRHFLTVIVGFGVTFGSFFALAGVARHYAQGRISDVLPMFCLAGAGIGVCIVLYGICRGVIDMILGLVRGKR